MRIVLLCVLATSAAGCARTSVVAETKPSVRAPHSASAGAAPRLASLPAAVSTAEPPAPPLEPPPALPPPPPPPPPTLAERLALPVEVPLGSRLHLGAGESFGPGESFFFKLPRGWVDERTNGGTVWNGLGHPRRPDGAAKVVITSLGWKIGDAQIDAWTRFLHVKDAAWGAPREEAIGDPPTNALVADGRGTLDGAPAHLVYAVVTPGKNGSILVVGAVKTDAPDAAKDELVASVRSVAKR